MEIMVEPTHITDFLEHNALKFPDKPALVTDERTLSWHELHAETLKLAADIAERLPASDRQQVVALLLPNSWQCMVAYLGILATGNIGMPLDMAYKPLELKAVLQAIPPKLLITSADFQFRDHLKDQPLINFDQLGKNPPKNFKTLRLPADQQIASLMFTSGTTGKPKAAPYTHANHLWNIELSTRLWGWQADDTLLISLPLSHWHGVVMGISGAVRHGNTLYLRPRFDVEDTLRWLSSGKISIHQHVSLAYVKMAAFEDYAKYDLSRVRLFTSASSALPPAAWHEFKKRYGHEVLECYGSAEAGRILSNTITDRQPGTPGWVIDGVQLRLGEDGEVQVRTPGLFPGYYQNPQATAENFTTDGWWKMGDLGEPMPDARIRLKGRTQERAKKLGYSVYTRDVEWAIQQHPAIYEAYVLGMHQDGRADDRLVYFVVGKLRPEELEDYSRHNLPSYWRPDDIIMLPQIPRTRTGKPQLQVMRDIWRQTVPVG
jgi:malonyl-CoA/methylmalonyl-CoA synthetase